MASSSLALCVDIEPVSSNGNPSRLLPIPTTPERAVSRTYHSVPQAPPEAIELDPLQWEAKSIGPVDSETASPSGMQSSMTMRDLEMSRPTSPAQGIDGTFEAMHGLWDPPMNKFRMLAVSLVNFTLGLNDSAPGPLIPYIESHYDIGYAIVSLIFITNALGFISAAFVVDVARARLGRARTMILANTLVACGYVPIIFTPPFPVVMCCFFLTGLGNAVNLALGNFFTANLQNGTQMLGIMHGSYGVGGTVGPLMATAMVTSGGLIWSRFYVIPFSMTIFNAAFTGWSFWSYEKESLTRSLSLDATRVGISGPRDNITSVNGSGGQVIPLTPVKPMSQFSNMARAFKNKVVLLGALFIFAYQGAEVSISGWVVSFLLASRNGNPSSIGYVTAGFWGGITIGRFVLSQPAHKIGEKVFVYGVVLGAAAFQLLVWLVPNVVGNAVAVAIVGLLLGPVYPCAAAVFTRSIPHSSQVSGMSVISAVGSSGGAMAPFMTGILAQAVGTFVLHPIAIGLFAAMLGSWYRIPNARKRRV